MKKIALTLAPLLLLVACTNASTGSYRLEIENQEADVRKDVTDASIRVIDRRLQSMGESLIESSINTEGEDPVITITVADPSVLIPLTEGLTGDFSLALMRKTGSGETAEITVDGHGGYISTGITEEDVLWAKSEVEPLTGKGRVSVLFTEAGRAEMRTVFAENTGKSLGLFVREKLVSNLVSQAGEIVDNITIGGIPTPDLAEAFVDDVNVGVHVTFVPLQ